MSVGVIASGTVSAPVSARASASASAHGSATASASIASSITWRRRDLQTPPCHAQRVLMIYDLGQGGLHMELKEGGGVGRCTQAWLNTKLNHLISAQTKEN